MGRMEALVRVDGRRWDLRLKDGSLIQLPAIGEDAALIQLDQLDQKDRLLDLGFERIDLRDPEMVVVRPRAPAASPPRRPRPHRPNPYRPSRACGRTSHQDLRGAARCRRFGTARTPVTG